MQKVHALILAAGKGTRMRSAKHKVLHPVCGKPMVEHLLGQLAELGVSKTIMVVGHQGDAIRNHLKERVIFVEQQEQLGTAHAVLQAKPMLQDEEGTVLVLNGDHPLFTSDSLRNLITTHLQSHAATTVLTATMDDPTGYGRIIRKSDGSVKGIVEHKDATEEQRLIREISTGTYCFDIQQLFQALSQVNNDNAQGEYYLPDVISIQQEEGERISAEIIKDVDEAMGVNDRVQLAMAENYMRKRIIKNHMEQGVSIIDPAQTYIDADVQIGPDSVIEPGTFLRGKTQIGEGCQIGPHTDLTNVKIQDYSRVQHSVIMDSEIGSDVHVGPYAYIRPGSYLGESSKVGSFVDLKKATLGKGTKVSHLAYVGDAEVGDQVNVGCGVVTVNYDGEQKHKTLIKDGAFIGCNVNLVAPVTVSENAYIAAGSTITNDVPEDSLAIARERQMNKIGYATRLKSKK